MPARAIPQLEEVVGLVHLGVPPLDLRCGLPHNITVQLKGVARQLSLREGGLYKPRWGAAQRREDRKNVEKKDSERAVGGKKERINSNYKPKV